MTLQTNSYLQKHLKAGLISVNFGCLNVRHPSQAPAPVYFCSQQRLFHLSWMLTLWQDESLKLTKKAFILLRLWEVNLLNINSFSQFVNDFWKWKLVFPIDLGKQVLPQSWHDRAVVSSYWAACHNQMSPARTERFTTWFWTGSLWILL